MQILLVGLFSSGSVFGQNSLAYLFIVYDVILYCTYNAVINVPYLYIIISEEFFFLRAEFETILHFKTKLFNIIIYYNV